jgi:hypothetical protein
MTCAWRVEGTRHFITSILACYRSIGAATALTYKRPIISKLSFFFSFFMATSSTVNGQLRLLSSPPHPLSSDVNQTCVSYPRTYVYRPLLT